MQIILLQSENFFTPPLDAALPGPILFGIQEYEPEKNVGRAVETVKDAHI
ncbi:hypothetical protein EJP617_04010 [Erwinia sp. Ejp617]|nr:hypothetical protein EJP617_04010 [Erwinia sp. Ejp617]